MSQAAEQAENIRLLRDSAAAVAPRDGDLRRVRALRFNAPGFDPAVWRQMCDMGWVGLRVAEADGGAGLGMSEFCALAEELGGGLAPEPLVTASMAAQMLRGDALEALLSGRRIILPAWQEQADTITAGPDTVLRDGRVYGRKLFVPMAGGADAFLVTVQGGLALVDRDAPGLTVDLALTQDGGALGTLTFDGAAAEPIAGSPDDAIEEAILATAATLLGLTERCFELTLEYLRTRKQFGRPIGSFQALQHRAADLKLQIALSRASVEAAAATFDAGAPAALRRAVVSRAKARAADVAMLITRQSIQLHGGIGYTDEYDAGLYLRRAMVLANSFGSSKLHRVRYAALMPESDDD